MPSLTQSQIDKMVHRNATIKDFKDDLLKIFKDKENSFGAGERSVHSFDERGVTICRKYHQCPAEYNVYPWSHFLTPTQ
jgi:hypothetical protein